MVQKKQVMALMAGAALVLGAGFLLRGDTNPGQAPQVSTDPVATATAMVAIQMPSISGLAAAGQALFTERCAACHGENGTGNVEAGPPLIHKIYEPGHHGDESFQRAVAIGVQGHHWRFGDMPAQEGLSRADVDKIIAFVRAVQRANGIN